MTPPRVSPPPSSPTALFPIDPSDGCPSWPLPLVLPLPPPAEFLGMVKDEVDVIHVFGYSLAQPLPSLFIQSFLTRVCIHRVFHLFLHSFICLFIYSLFEAFVL